MDWSTALVVIVFMVLMTYGLQKALTHMPPSRSNTTRIVVLVWAIGLAAHVELVERSANLLETSFRPAQTIEKRQMPAPDPVPISPTWTLVKAGQAARRCEVLFNDKQRVWQVRVRSGSLIRVTEFGVGVDAFAAAEALLAELERDGWTAP
jgi:hypothetical protein